MLEVKILAIDFAIDYGYNGCSGFLPENCDRAVGARIIPINEKAKTYQPLGEDKVPNYPTSWLPTARVAERWQWLVTEKP